MSRYSGKDRHWRRRESSRKPHVDNVTLDEREKSVNHWSTPQFNYRNCGYNSNQYANYSTYPYQLPNSWQYQFFDQTWGQGPATWLTQSHSSTHSSQRPWQGNSSYGSKSQYHRTSSSFQQDTEQEEEEEEEEVQRAASKSQSPPLGSEEARKKALAQAADKLKLCLQSFEPQKSEVLENLLANKEDNVERLKKDKKRQEPKSSLSVLDRSHFVPELQLTPKDLKDIGMVNSGVIADNPSDMSDVTIVSESYRAVIDTIALEDSMDGSLCGDEPLDNSSLDPTPPLDSVQNEVVSPTPLQDVVDPNCIKKESFLDDLVIVTCPDTGTPCEPEPMDIVTPGENDINVAEQTPTEPLFPGPQKILRRVRYTSESLNNSSSPDKSCSSLSEESPCATTKLRARSASLCISDPPNDGDGIKAGLKHLQGSPGLSAGLDNRAKGLKQTIIQQLLSMSRSNLKDLVNNPRSRKLEFAMKHLVKEHRMLLSRQLRALAQARIQGQQIPEDQDSSLDPDSVLLDPDLAVNLSSLPLEIIEQLGNILQMDLLDCVASDSEGNVDQGLEELEALQEVLCSENHIHNSSEDPSILSEPSVDKIEGECMIQKLELEKCGSDASDLYVSGLKQSEEVANATEVRKCDRQPDGPVCATDKGESNKTPDESVPEPSSMSRNSVDNAGVQADSSTLGSVVCKLPDLKGSNCATQRLEVSNKQPIESENAGNVLSEVERQDKACSVALLTEGKMVDRVERAVGQQCSSCSVSTQTQSTNALDASDIQRMVLLLEQSRLMPRQLSQLLRDHFSTSADIVSTASNNDDICVDMTNKDDCVSVNTVKIRNRSSSRAVPDIESGDCSGPECTVGSVDITRSGVCSMQERTAKKGDFIIDGVAKNGGSNSLRIAKCASVARCSDSTSADIVRSNDSTSADITMSCDFTSADMASNHNSTSTEKSCNDTSTNITMGSNCNNVSKSDNHTIANVTKVGDFTSAVINKNIDHTRAHTAKSGNQISANCTKTRIGVGCFNSGAHTNTDISKCSHYSILRSCNIPKGSNHTTADIPTTSECASVDFSKSNDHVCVNINRTDDYTCANNSKHSNATCTNNRSEDASIEIARSGIYSNTNSNNNFNSPMYRDLSCTSTDITKKVIQKSADVGESSLHTEVNCAQSSGILNIRNVDEVIANSTSLNVTCNVKRTEQSIYLEMLKIDKDIQSLMGQKIELYKKLKLGFSTHSCSGEGCGPPHTFASQKAATAGNCNEQAPVKSVVAECSKPMVYIPLQTSESLPGVFHATKYDRNMFVTCDVEALENSAPPEQSPVRSAVTSDSSTHSPLTGKNNVLNKHFKQMGVSVVTTSSTSGLLECRSESHKSNVDLSPKSLESTFEKLLNCGKEKGRVTDTDSIKKDKRSKLGTPQGKAMSKQDTCIQRFEQSHSLVDQNTLRSRSNRQRSSTTKKQSENSEHEEGSKLIRTERSRISNRRKRGKEINEMQQKSVMKEQPEVEKADPTAVLAEKVDTRNAPSPPLGSTMPRIRTKTATLKAESTLPSKVKSARRKTECESLATPEELAAVLASGRRRRMSSQIAEAPNIEEQLPLSTDRKITRSSKAPKLFPVKIEPSIHSDLLKSHSDNKIKKDVHSSSFSDVCEFSEESSSRSHISIKREESELEHQLDTHDACGGIKGNESDVGHQSNSPELQGKKKGRKSELDHLLTAAETNTRRKGQETQFENQLHTLKTPNKKENQELKSEVFNRKRSGNKFEPAPQLKVLESNTRKKTRAYESEILNNQKDQCSDSEQQSDSSEMFSKKKGQSSEPEDTINTLEPYTEKKSHKMESEQQSFIFEMLNIKKEPELESEQHSDESEVHKRKKGLKSETDILDASVVCRMKIGNESEFQHTLHSSGLPQTKNDQGFEHHSNSSDIFSVKIKQDSESEHQSDTYDGPVIKERQEYASMSESEHQSDASETSATTVSKIRSFRMESRRKTEIRSEFSDLPSAKDISPSLCSSNEMKRKSSTYSDEPFSKRKCLAKQAHQEIIRDCFVLIKPLTSTLICHENMSDLTVTNTGESSTQSESFSFISDLNNSCEEDGTSRTLKSYMMEQESNNSEVLCSSSEDDLPIKMNLESPKENSRPATPLDPTREIESQLALLEQMSSQLVKHPAQAKNESNELPVETDLLNIESNTLPTPTDLLSTELDEHAIKQDVTILNINDSPVHVVLSPDAIHDDNSISTLVSDTVSVQSDVEPGNSKRPRYEASTVEDCDKDSVCSSKSVKHKSPRKHKHDKKSESVDRMVFQDHSGPILDIKTIGKHFLAASEDGNVYCYSLKSGKLKRKYEGHNAAVICLCVSDCTTSEQQIEESERTPELVFTGSLDNQLRCFAFKTGILIMQPVDIGSPIQCMDQNWGTIFLGTKGGDIVKFHIESSKVMGDPMKCSKESILALKTTKEGPRKVLVVGTRNGPITIRDAYSGLLMRMVTNRWPHTVYSLLLDTSLVYCGTKSGIIPVIEFTTGDEKFRFQSGLGVVCMKIYNNLLFAGCYDGNIYIYSIQDESLLTCIPGPGKMLLCLDVIKNRIIAGSKDNTLQACTFPTEVRNYLKEVKHR